jgi:hypothetical protein
MREFEENETKMKPETENIRKVAMQNEGRPFLTHAVNFALASVIRFKFANKQKKRIRKGVRHSLVRAHHWSIAFFGHRR